MHTPARYLHPLFISTAIALLLLAVSACAAPPATPEPKGSAPTLETNNLPTLTPTPPPPLPTASATAPLATPTAAPTLTSVPLASVTAAPPTPTDDPTIKGGTVWSIVINSQTSRQFMDAQKGILQSTCFTNWRFDLFYIARKNGRVQGHGYGATQKPLFCSPQALPVMDPEMLLLEVYVGGTQDSTSHNLQLEVLNYEPFPSADSGGAELLFSNGSCPPIQRTLAIPIEQAKPGNTPFTMKAEGQLNNCGEYGKDVMKAESVIEISQYADCADLPSNFDKDILGMCR